MTSELYGPTGQPIATAEEAPPVDTSQLLLTIAQNTAATGRMLDVLVRLECGALKRADLKKDILETEAAIAAMRAEHEALTAEQAVEAADRAATDVAHAEYHGKDPEQDNLPEALTAE